MAEKYAVDSTACLTNVNACALPWAGIAAWSGCKTELMGARCHDNVMRRGALAGLPAALRGLSRSRVMEGRDPAHQPARASRDSAVQQVRSIMEEKMHVSNNRIREHLARNTGARCSKRRGNHRVAGAMLHVADNSVRCGCVRCVRDVQGQEARHSDAQPGRQRVCREQEPIHDDAERLGRQDMACGDVSIQNQADARRDLIVALAALTRPWPS